MKASRLVFNLYFLTQHLLIFGANGANIQFYKHDNFTGLIFAGNGSANCNNIPEEKMEYVNSIRSDVCLITYYHWGCKSIWSEKYLPGDINLSEHQLGKYSHIRSFHTCNKYEGGSQLNVDISEYFRSAYVVPDVVESYTNVCSCVNVPKIVQNMPKWSIDNHHNVLLVFYERDCSVNKLNYTRIQAGHNWVSKYMHLLEKKDISTNTAFKIQSFGPDPNSSYFYTSCIISEVVTANIRPTVDGTTENILDTDVDGNNKVTEGLSNSNVESRTQTETSKQSEDIFQSEKFMKALAKLWSYSYNQHETSKQMSNWTCISCFDNKT